MVAALTKEYLEIYAKDKERRQKLMKGMMMVLWYLLYDEDTQVHGFLYLNDFTGYTMQHFTFFPTSDMKDLMKWQVRARLKPTHETQRCIKMVFRIVFYHLNPSMCFVGINTAATSSLCAYSRPNAATAAPAVHTPAAWIVNQCLSLLYHSIILLLRAVCC